MTTNKKPPSMPERRVMVQACANRLKEQLESSTDDNAGTEWVVMDNINNAHPNIAYQVRSYGEWLEVELDDEHSTALIGITHISEDTQDFVNAITEALSKEYPMVSIIWSEAAGNWLNFDVSFHLKLDPNYRWWRHESIYNN